ncbi:hypothetical protein DMENIID0001_050160 [Sergentomyia squamirostris]
MADAATGPSAKLQMQNSVPKVVTEVASNDAAAAASAAVKPTPVVTSAGAQALSQNRKPKCTSFQITSVIVGSRYSADYGDDSADDLDESHTDDISRVTDYGNETPSFSEDTSFSKDDAYVGTAPVIPTSSQYGLAIVPPEMNGTVSVTEAKGGIDKASATTVTESKPQNAEPTVKEPISRSDRFKVVKIESTEPFKRGRWMCMDYLDHSALQQQAAALVDKAFDSKNGNVVTKIHNVIPGQSAPAIFYNTAQAAALPVLPKILQKSIVTTNPATTTHHYTTTSRQTGSVASTGRYQAGQTQPIRHIAAPPQAVNKLQGATLPADLRNYREEIATVQTSVTTPHTTAQQHHATQVTPSSHHQPVREVERPKQVPMVAANVQPRVSVAQQTISNGVATSSAVSSPTVATQPVYPSAGQNVTTKVVRTPDQPHPGQQQIHHHQQVQQQHHPAPTTQQSAQPAQPSTNQQTPTQVKQQQQPTKPAQPQQHRQQSTADGHDEKPSVSAPPPVAIDNKIEQAMDLVKSHLMYAVREEVEVLKEKIAELMDRINQLEVENTILKANATQETLSQLSATLASGKGQPSSNTGNGSVS